MDQNHRDDIASGDARIHPRTTRKTATPAPSQKADCQDAAPFEFPSVPGPAPADAPAHQAEMQYPNARSTANPLNLFDNTLHCQASSDVPSTRHSRKNHSVRFWGYSSVFDCANNSPIRHSRRQDRSFPVRLLTDITVLPISEQLYSKTGDGRDTRNALSAFSTEHHARSTRTAHRNASPDVRDNTTKGASYRPCMVGSSRFASDRFYGPGGSELTRDGFHVMMIIVNFT